MARAFVLVLALAAFSYICFRAAYKSIATGIAPLQLNWINRFFRIPVATNETMPIAFWFRVGVLLILSLVSAIMIFVAIFIALGFGR